MTLHELEYPYDTTTSRLDLAPTPEICALVQDLLPLYLEGEVNPGSRDTIVNHLARCERCAGYLAGAQSMRVQLRREAASHMQARTAALPEQQALQRWQRMLAGFTALFISIVGGLASIALASGLYTGQPALAFLGLLIGSGALAALLTLARAVAPLAGNRLQQIGAGVLVGVVAPLIGQSHNEMFQITAMFMALAALTLVSLAVAHGGEAR
jgi:anti-sigma factor RsiW